MKNKMSKAISKTVVKTLGMLFTLSGIAVVFASCYGPPPGGWEPAPDESQLYGNAQTCDSVQQHAEVQLPQEEE